MTNPNPGPGIRRGRSKATPGGDRQATGFTVQKELKKKFQGPDSQRLKRRRKENPFRPDSSGHRRSAIPSETGHHDTSSRKLGNKAARNHLNRGINLKSRVGLGFHGRHGNKMAWGIQRGVGGEACGRLLPIKLKKPSPNGAGKGRKKIKYLLTKRGPASARPSGKGPTLQACPQCRRFKKGGGVPYFTICGRAIQEKKILQG